ncbi:hypothetical protein ACFWXO_29820 [Kitasatospora sp. NPDC059088]|uniref:hypothetical protein n=1 Tax=Kitasatospora sp. NPDC059088 TaxID=3346722 RepID=UPI0036801A34
MPVVLKPRAGAPTPPPKAEPGADQPLADWEKDLIEGEKKAEEAPAAEAPAAEAPVAETPAVEAPVAEAPATDAPAEQA